MAALPSRAGSCIIALLSLLQGCSSPSTIMREPASIIPPGGFRSVLRMAATDSGGEARLSKWLLDRGAVETAEQGAELAARLQAELSTASRSEILEDVRLRSILSKDLESLGDEDLLFLKAWATARSGARAGRMGADAAQLAARRTEEFKKIVERTLFAASERRPEARASVLAFLKDIEPMIKSGELEPELLSAVIRRVQWSKVGEAQMPDALSTLKLMLSYHRSELDPGAAAKALNDPALLPELKEAYLSGLLVDVPDPRLVGLVSKGGPAEALVIEREFAATRDEMLARVDQLRWFTKNPVKAIDLEAQRTLTELDYLVRIGDKKAARAMASRKFLAVETAVLYVQKYRELVAQAVARGAPSSEINELKRVLVVEERVLGSLFEEYRVVRTHLDDLAAKAVTGCDDDCAAFARELDESIGLSDLKRLSFKVSFEGMSRPSLAQVQDIFFSSQVAQVADLRKMVHTEAFHTLKSIGSSILLLEEIQKIAARIPSLGKRFEWTRKLLFMLYDGRARHVHFPEISRIMRAKGGIKERLSMVEQMSLPPNEDLMVTLARRMEEPVRDFWRQLKAEARAQAGDLAQPQAADGSLGGVLRRLEAGERVTLIERMEAAEKQAAALGGISFYYDQSPAVKLGVLAVAGSYGAYAWLSDDAPEKREADKASKEAAEAKKEIDKHATEAEKRRIREGVERSQRARQAARPGRQEPPAAPPRAEPSQPSAEERAREIERAREAARRAARGGGR